MLTFSAAPVIGSLIGATYLLFALRRFPNFDALFHQLWH